MKRWMALMSALVVALPASAQFYMPIPYRGNNPFVFCREGWSTGRMGWKPSPPYNGTAYVVLRPHKYWSRNDWSALWYYQTVCPHGIGPGA